MFTEDKGKVNLVDDPFHSLKAFKYPWISNPLEQITHNIYYLQAYILLYNTLRSELQHATLLSWLLYITFMIDNVHLLSDLGFWVLDSKTNCKQDVSKELTTNINLNLWGLNESPSLIFVGNCHKREGNFIFIWLTLLYYSPSWENSG